MLFLTYFYFDLISSYALLKHHAGDDDSFLHARSDSEAGRWLRKNGAHRIVKNSTISSMHSEDNTFVVPIGCNSEARLLPGHQECPGRDIPYPRTSDPGKDRWLWTLDIIWMYRNHYSQFLKWDTDNCFIKMWSSSPMCFILLCVKLQRPQSPGCEDGFWIVLSEVSLLGCWHTKCHQRHRGFGCLDVVLLLIWMKMLVFRRSQVLQNSIEKLFGKHTLSFWLQTAAKTLVFERQEQRLNVIRTSFGVKLTPRVALTSLELSLLRRSLTSSLLR